MSDFVHLHNHTEYSLLDGSLRLSELVAATREYGQKAVAMTDHGVLYGMVKFYKKAREEGIKPIIGCEVYLTPGDRREKKDRELYHLVLLAASDRGYNNLLEIVTKSHLEGYYYRPRVDKDLLYKNRRGLIATSACLQGEIPTRILAGNFKEAEKSVREYREIFGRENFFLELQDHGLPEQKKVNPELKKFSKEFDLGLVAANDSHYLEKSDAEFHDVLLALQTNSEVADTDRMTFPNDEFYLKSPREMRELFSEEQEAIKNTGRIADRCEVNLDFDRFFLPEYPEASKQDLSAEEMLRKKCRERLDENFPDDEKARERMEYELEIICDMGYAAYFLIVQDFVEEAKKRGIRVGPGRGSAAGSFVSYLLGITKVNPLDYGLIFERFLNPARVSLPDIDIDFDERRDEIIDYVSRRYGQERVAQIGTFGTMAARGAIRDVGRALGMDYDTVDRVAKSVPLQSGKTLDELMESDSSLQKMADESEKVAELLNIARKLEGLPRHISTHAAGVIIGPDKLMDFVPLQKQEETIITQLPMEDVEALGLLKMDFLGLRNLTVIEDSLERIEKNHGKNIDIDEVPLDDDEVYEMLSRGETAGVFQMESQLFKDLTANLKPEYFTDIIALLALGRPGPLGSGLVDDYIKCRHGEKEPEYLHPGLQPILQETYGLILYQEQVMEIASELGNFSMGEADILRRGMGKKKKKLVAEKREQFVEGALENGLSGDIANEIFDQMEYFSGYGFNKSHSAAYALLAYQTAYLKCKFPAEFMAALLTSVMDNLDKVSDYISTSREMGIEIYSPDVNESDEGFTALSDEEIRFGLKAIKHLGRKAIEEITNRRSEAGEFENVHNLLDRCDLSRLQKSDMEALIKAGALDEFEAKRSQLLSSLEELHERFSEHNSSRARGQTSFFELVEEEDKFYEDDFTFPELEEIDHRTRLNQEREYLGLYLSGHPLDPYSKFFQGLGVQSRKLVSLVENSRKEHLLLGGLISGIREHTTKNDRKMAFLTLEGRSGSIDVVVFPGAYTGAVRMVSERQAVLVYGRPDEDQLIASRVIPLFDSALLLEVGSISAEEMERIIDFLEESASGMMPVIFKQRKNSEICCWLPPEKLWLEGLERAEKIPDDDNLNLEIKSFNFS